MKYLRKFNENLTDNKSIDWDFIYDVKELSLEYIDSGWELAWGVECLNSLVRPSEYKTYTIVSGLYNHNENTTTWSYHYDEDEDFSNDKLSYEFYLTKKDGLGMSIIRGILNKEFKNKIRSMFPDKDFDII
jgi:hypothetical protein